MPTSLVRISGSLPAREISVVGDGVDEAVKAFRAKYPNGRIEHVDGDLVRGECRECRRPILQHTQGYKYHEDQFTCPQCLSRSSS